MSKLIVAKSNRGAPDPIGLHDAGGTIINPATNDKLEEVRALLALVHSAVDELELKFDTLNINADSINLNTDELEAKVQSVRDQLDVLLSTRASEATLIQIRDYVDTVEIKLQSLIDKNQAQETGGNLDAIKINLDDIKTKLDTLNAKDFATETTLNDIKGLITTINSNIDVALSTRATEATALLIKSNLDDVKTKLDTLNAKDFATETTLASIDTKTGEVSATPTVNTILGRLKEIEDKIKEFSLDQYSKACKVIVQEHSKIHDGVGYQCTIKLTVVKSTSAEILLVNPSLNFPHLRNFSVKASSAPGTVDLYKGTTVSANGTAQAIKNCNNNSSNVPDLAIYLSPTITANGEEIDADLILGDKTTGGNIKEVVQEWILAQNTNYLLRYTNTSTLDANIIIKFFWYE